MAEPRLDRDPMDAHHVVPRCLLALHERANGEGGDELDGAAIHAWLEWEMEAMRWRVPAEISRADLERLVEASGVAPTRPALVVSQVVLAFGIAFALIPLPIFCRNRGIVGSLVNYRLTAV